jgi:hypothetical protein
MADGSFSCEACGKSYTWKPALAGKKAKCGCGTVMSVPPAPTLVAAPRRQVAVPSAPAAATLAVPAPAVSSPVSSTYGYVPTRRRPLKEKVAEDKFLSPIRDTYAPLALIFIGLVGMVLWGVVGAEGGLSFGILVLVGSLIITLIKTAVLVGLAILIAPHAGLSLGTFWTAVLKIAAIVVFSDAVLMWIEQLMQNWGAVPTTGYGFRRGRRFVWWMEMIIATAVIATLLHYLFDMDRDETGTVAMPIAIASWIMGLILKVALVAMLQRATDGAAGVSFEVDDPYADGSAADVAPTNPTGPPGPPPRKDVTDGDRIISGRIEQRSPFVKPAHEWNEQRLLRGRGQKQLFENLFDAGATRIYADTQATLGMGATLYVELPLDAARRTKCFEAYKTYCSDAGVDVDSARTKDVGQRYLVIDVKR